MTTPDAARTAAPESLPPSASVGPAALGAEVPLRLTRVLNAPRPLVWAAFTRLEHLSRWMGPKGWPLIGGSLDLRIGGTYHYGMGMPDGQVMWGKWTFREIVPEQKLVVVAQFSDEHQGVTRAPFFDEWPLATLSTTTLADEGPGRTRVTLDWRPLEATEAEVKAFASQHASMNNGWNGTYDQLEAYLAALPART